MYDGTTGDVIGRLDSANGHSGSIYSCAWNDTGSRLVTSGADKTVRVWDMSVAPIGVDAIFPSIALFTLGTKPEDMQNAVAWSPVPGGSVVSLSLDGTLNVFSTAAMAHAAAGAPSSRVVGHVAPVNVLDLDATTGMMFTGDQAGRVVVWTPTNDARTVYEARLASGDVPTKKLAAVAVAGGALAAAAWDDKLRIGDAATGVFNTTVALPGQPKGVAGSFAVPGVWIVATGSAIVVVCKGAIAKSVDAQWGPTCVDVSPDGKLVAVGGGDKKVHLFALAGAELTPIGDTKEAGAAISAVAISPDGSRMAAGDALKEVRLYTAAGEPLVSGRWMQHTTRITGLRWNPAGTLIASVSSDRRLCIWDPAHDAGVKKSYDLAHTQPFAGVVWASDDAVWTLGIDGVVARMVLVL